MAEFQTGDGAKLDAPAGFGPGVVGVMDHRSTGEFNRGINREFNLWDQNLTYIGNNHPN